MRCNASFASTSFEAGHTVMGAMPLLLSEPVSPRTKQRPRVCSEAPAECPTTLPDVNNGAANGLRRNTSDLCCAAVLRMVWR
jgi:hypothetical protein